MKQIFTIIFSLFVSIVLSQEIDISDTIQQNDTIPYYLPSYCYYLPSIELKNKNNILHLPKEYQNKGITGKMYTCFYVDKHGKIHNYVLMKVSLRDSLDNEIINFFNRDRIHEYSDTLQVFYRIALEKKEDIIITVDSNFVDYIKDAKMSFGITFTFEDD